MKSAILVESKKPLIIADIDLLPLPERNNFFGMTDQEKKTGENPEAEASFERDMAASEEEPRHSVDEIMDELND